MKVLHNVNYCTIKSLTYKTKTNDYETNVIYCADIIVSNG